MTARVPALEAMKAVFDSAVHSSARSDRVMWARQRSFITSHVLGALLSLIVFIAFFAIVGLPTPYALIACGWFLTPLLIALYASRTGRLGRAHFLSAANLIGLVVLVAALTGGLHSFAIVWMIVVPLEAAMSGSRRIIISSGLAALAALVALYGLSEFGYLSQPINIEAGAASLGLFSHLAAATYSCALALNIEAIHNHAAQAVGQEHARFRLLADNATDLISRHGADGRVMFASPASRQMTGEPPEALNGNGLLERVLVADRPAYLAALDDAVMGATTDVEFRLRRIVAGSNEPPRYFWAEMRCRPANSASSDVEAASSPPRGREVVAVTRDMSRHKLYETELLDARANADTANRAKSLFLANMSHELRTPLNAIIGFSDILNTELKGLPEGERWSEHCAIIRDSGHQLLTMVNELLDISKIESGHYRLDIQPVDVEAVAIACRSTLTPALAKKALRVDIEAPDDLPDIEADPRCIRQMLLNLLGNAVKFSNEGAVIKAVISRDGESVVVRIIDRGIGIASADIDRLGQPFVQANSSYNRHHEGTGLGLSLVKGMTRLHGGKFTIESELGLGTTVCLVLPVSRGAAPSSVVVPPVEHRGFDRAPHQDVIHINARAEARSPEGNAGRAPHMQTGEAAGRGTAPSSTSLAS